MRMLSCLCSLIGFVCLSLSGRSETRAPQTNDQGIVKLEPLSSYPMHGSGGSVQINGNQVVAYYHGYEGEIKGCLVLDISNRRVPRLVRTTEFDQSTTTPQMSQPRFPVKSANVFQSGRLAYVSGYREGLFIFDTNNPTSPTLVGKYKMNTGPAKIYVHQDKAYLATMYLDGQQIGYLWILDVSHPTLPRLIGKYCTQGAVTGVLVRERYAYVTTLPDEKFGGFQIIDVSHPEEPRLVGHCSTPGIAGGMVLEGNLALINDTDHGVQLIDVGDPRKPRIIANFYSEEYKKEDCYLTAYGIAVANGLMFVTWKDGNDPMPGGGLQIVDIRRFIKPSRTD